MNRIPRNLVPVICCLVMGCAAAGMNSVQKLNQLSPGMSSDEVIALLGDPSSSEMSDSAWVLKFTLHENWKGFVPYYMTFDPQTKQLLSWRSDEEEYQQNQQAMGALFAPLLSSSQGGAAAPAGPNDPDLQKWITGTYYSFSSSMVVSAASERTFVLCVNGRFRISTESSYSGTPNSDGTTNWGAASQGGDTGSWSISGDRQSGTINLSYDGGTANAVKYQVGSEDGVMYFDDVKFAYAGAAQCQ